MNAIRFTLVIGAMYAAGYSLPASAQDCLDFTTNADVARCVEKQSGPPPRKTGAQAKAPPSFSPKTSSNSKQNIDMGSPASLDEQSKQVWVDNLVIRTNQQNAGYLLAKQNKAAEYQRLSKMRNQAMESAAQHMANAERYERASQQTLIEGARVIEEMSRK